MSSMPRDVLKWVQSLDLTWQIKVPQWDLANGYLVAEIFSWYFPREVEMHMYNNGKSLDSKERNWYLIKNFVKRNKLEIAADVVDGTIHCKEGAAGLFLERMFELMTNREVRKVPPQPVIDLTDRSYQEKLPLHARSTASQALKNNLKTTELIADKSIILAQQKATDIINNHIEMRRSERIDDPQRFDRKPTLGEMCPRRPPPPIKSGTFDVCSEDKPRQESQQSTQGGSVRGVSRESTVQFKEVDVKQIGKPNNFQQPLVEPSTQPIPVEKLIQTRKEYYKKDTVLSERGKRQAELVGQRLQMERFSHVFCSDLARAVQTCEYIVKQNRFSNAIPVYDKRLRERGFGDFEGKPAIEFQAAVKRCKGDVHSYVPLGGESLQQLRSRAQDFFEELCSKLLALVDHSNSGDGQVGGKRRRNTTSIGSDVFPVNDQNLELLTADPQKPSSNAGHANSGSTSSGCSSITADFESQSDQSCDPSESSQDVDSGAPLSPDLPTSDISPSQESSSSSFSEEDDHILCPLVDSDIRSNVTPPRGVQYGCPNVSLSPIFEHRLSSVSSISSGRNNSFDEGDIIPTLLAEVLIVAHGGLLKELIGYLIDEFGCKVPGGKKNALQAYPNTGICKFTVTLGSAGELPRVTCLTFHDKDHLIDEEEPIEKPADFYA